MIRSEDRDILLQFADALVHDDREDGYVKVPAQIADAVAHQLRMIVLLDLQDYSRNLQAFLGRAEAAEVRGGEE